MKQGGYAGRAGKRFKAKEENRFQRMEPAAQATVQLCD